MGDVLLVGGFIIAIIVIYLALMKMASKDGEIDG